MVGHFFFLSIIFYILSNLFVFYAFKINNLFKFQFKNQLVTISITIFILLTYIYLGNPSLLEKKNIQNQNIAGINVSEFREAFNKLENLARSDLNNIEAQLNYGKSLKFINRTEDSESVLYNLYQIEPNNVEVITELLEVMKINGNHESDLYDSILLRGINLEIESIKFLTILSTHYIEKLAYEKALLNLKKIAGLVKDEEFHKNIKATIETYDQFNLLKKKQGPILFSGSINKKDSMSKEVFITVVDESNRPIIAKYLNLILGNTKFILNLNDIIDINYFNNIVNNNKKIKIRVVEASDKMVDLQSRKVFFELPIMLNQVLKNKETIDIKL